jgi:DNA-nicking Smr family endonuclease
VVEKGQKKKATAECLLKVPAEKTDEDLFKEAMSGVQPIERGEHLERKIQRRLPPTSKNDSGERVHRELTRLLKYGEGFVIANTPEYIEGTGYNVDKSMARRLHHGEFAIEAYIDLHGHTVETAREAFDKFLEDSLRTGKRAVLIVHGRGLSSPQKPVLKSKVREWLTQGLWRKWVVAFSSAQSYDGGVGATYVLLRKQPVTKRHRKATKRKE